VKLLLGIKTLSKIEYFQVLQIIGFSNVPLSSRQIEKKWIKNFSSDRKTPNSYIYEIVKKLHKPEFAGQRDVERFVKVTYKETAQERIKNIQATEKDAYRAEWMIGKIKMNPRNWRYNLNIKGFLLYLNLVDEYELVVAKTVNSIINNLTNYQEFNFLDYFTIFGNTDKVKLLVEIARELKFNLNTYSREYLRFYIMKRYHEEISYWLAIENDFLIKKFSRFIKKKGIENDELIKELSNYKIKILYELIPFEQNVLEDLMIDLKRTKQVNYPMANKIKSLAIF